MLSVFCFLWGSLDNRDDLFILLYVVISNSAFWNRDLNFVLVFCAVIMYYRAFYDNRV